MRLWWVQDAMASGVVKVHPVNANLNNTDLVQGLRLAKLRGLCVRVPLPYIKTGDPT